MFFVKLWHRLVKSVVACHTQNTSQRNSPLLLHLFWGQELFSCLFIWVIGFSNSLGLLQDIFFCFFVMYICCRLITQPRRPLCPAEIFLIGASSSPGVVCQKGMLYHHCASFCRRSCVSLSSLEQCPEDCAEGCSCPEGKYYEDTLSFCVPM